MSHEVSHAYNKYKINYFYLESQYGGREKVALCKLKLLYISTPNGNRYFFHVELGDYLNIINKGGSIIIFKD